MTSAPTDFNDLHVLRGLNTVRDQLLAAVSQKPQPEPVDQQPEAPSHTQPEQRAAQPEADHRFGSYSLDQLVEHFALIYGTDTVWDGINRLQMRLSALRHAIGRDLFKLWDGHPQRRVIRGLAFEPAGDIPPDFVNLYGGIAHPRDRVGREGCMRILDHIYMLCGNRDAEFRWLVRWMAYPLQNPGAKMDSSVIMYGSEGPGKSVLWEKVLGTIYGEYAITIGQQQLESQFTGWQSIKLYAVCEEVVSRAERAQHKGQLKHLVTGRTLMINEKNLPLRQETNHLNFVFLSNSTVPLELDMGDRRYLVLYCGFKPEKAYFRELFSEINGNGLAAFYEYLMTLDLDGFDEHTPPPMTQEKENLIDISLPGPTLFWKEWKAGDLGIPYCSCPRGALFDQFQRWCIQKNEFKRRERDFVAELRRHMQEDRKDLRLPGSYDRKTTRLWITPEDAAKQHDSDYVARLEESCARFLDAVKDKGSNQP